MIEFNSPSNPAPVPTAGIPGMKKIKAAKAVRETL